MTELHPYDQEFEVIAVNLDILPGLLSVAAYSHTPTTSGIILSSGLIWTCDMQNRFNETKRAFLAESDIRNPYDLDAASESLGYRFSVHNQGRFIGDAIFKATRIGANRPRVFVPTVFEVDDKDSVFNPMRGGTVVWRTPEEAIAVLNSDDTKSPMHGVQRRAITRATLLSYMYAA